MRTRILLLVGILVGLCPMIGCRGLERIDNPEGWPSRWGGRSLRTTTSAWYYTRSDGAAGLVDEQVVLAGAAFREHVGRAPSRGLIVLKGPADDDLEIESGSSFVMNVESEASRDEVLSIIGQTEAELNESLRPIGELAGAVYTGHSRGALPGLPSQAALDAPWIVVLPTEKRTRQVVDELVTQQLDRAGANPLIRFFGGPFIKHAQDEMVRQLRFFHRVRVLEAMVRSDDLMDTAERVRLLESIGDEYGDDGAGDTHGDVPGRVGAD